MNVAPAKPPSHRSRVVWFRIGLLQITLAALGAGSGCHRADEWPAKSRSDSTESSRDVPSVDGSVDATPDEDAQVELRCGAQLALCDGACVDLRYDSKHCGACNAPCSAASICALGQCENIMCTDERVLCGGACTDPDRDRSHCGATGPCDPQNASAGVQCAPDEACRGGECLACPVFEPEKVTRTGLFGHCRAVVAGDFDQDGDLDVVATTMSEASQAQVFLLDEQRVLRPTETLGTGRHARGIKLDDLNADGTPDLVPLGSDGRVLLGNGTGGFTTLLPTGLSGNSRSVIPLRLNHDAHPDYLLWSFEKTLWLSFGQAGGTALAAQELALPAHPSGYATADFTGDGQIDLVLGQWTGSAPVLWRGSATGVFIGPEEIPISDMNATQAPVAGTADFNEDGLPDLLLGTSAWLGVSPGSRATGSWPNRNRVMLGLGDGRFSAPQALPYPEEPGFCEPADVNRDGHVDILLTLPLGAGTPNVGFMLGHGDGTFDRAVYYAAGYGGESWPRAAFADLTRDGLPDLVTCAEDRYLALQTEPGIGPGRFSAPRHFHPSEHVATKTLPKDDRKLLVGGSNVGIRATWFDSDLVRTKVLVEATDPRFVLEARLDADRDLDLAYIDQNLSVLRTFENLGEGSYVALAELPVASPTTSLLSGDVNGDHVTDLIHIASDFLTVFEGTGEGQMRAMSPIALPAANTLAVVAQVNQDDQDDLILWTQSNELHVWLSDGSQISARTDLPAIRAVHTAHINDDGLLDLIVVTGGYPRTLLGRGDGHFSEALPVASTVGTHQCVLGDLDRDGLTDIVYDAYDLERVMFGDGHGGFLSGPSRTSLGTPLRVDDFDGDGLADILSGGEYGMIFTRGRRGEGCP